ncbi:MAG TPA: type II secretion system protein [Armatimonadota bacterium]
MGRAQQRSGFTLIEIIVVLTMMVMFAGMVLPSYPGMVRSSQGRSAVAAIITLLRASREYAISHQRAVTLVYEPSDRSLQARAEQVTDSGQTSTNDSEEGTGSSTISDRLLPTVYLPENTEATINSETSTEEATGVTYSASDGITFEADGSCPSSDVVLQGTGIPEVTIQVGYGGSRVYVVEKE